MEVIVKKKSMCRICLVENVRMYVVTNKNLQELYEKLTDAPFVTEDIRPMLACSFCYTKLKQCWQLRRKCLEAEEVLTQMLNEDYEIKNGRNPSQLKYFGGLNISSLMHVDIFGDDNDDYEMQRSNVEGATGFCKRRDVAELQKEVLIHELKPNLYNHYLDLDDISPHQSEADSDQDQKYIPPHHSVFDSKTDGKARAVSMENRRDEKTEWAPAVKKTKRETQRNTLEGTITDMPETNRQSDAKMLCTTNNYPHKSVNKYNGTNEDKPINSNIRNNLKYSPKVSMFTPVTNNVSNVNDKKFNKNSNKNDLMSKVITKKDDMQKTFTCKKCQLSFTKYEYLEQHIRVNACENPYGYVMEHNVVQTGDKPYKCDVCQKSFSQQQNLTTHARVHTGEKPYRCHMCQESFNHNVSLKSHINTHLGVTRYKCEICQQGFNVKAKLTAHTRIHTGEKPFKCEICQRCFTQQHNLTAHIRIHTGEKPYKCHICPESFNHKISLKSHISTHSGVKRYNCEVCSQGFNVKAKLIVHNRVHTGEKPYKCEICQRCFSERPGLKRHFRIHTGEKPYKCKICQSSFRYRDKLKRHIRIHNA